MWTACQTEGIPWGPEFNSRTLMGLVKDIFSYGGTTTEQVAAEYFAKVHEWIPIVNEAWITAELKSISLQGYARPRDDALALLLLCMDMVNHHCRHPNHSPHSTLYRTTRRLFTLVDTANASHLLAKLQAGLLLTTYECGHGMAVEASSTLATCFGLMRQLDMSAWRNCSTGQPSYDCKRNLCWAAIVFLDRLVSPCHKLIFLFSFASQVLF